MLCPPTRTADPFFQPPYPLSATSYATSACTLKQAFTQTPLTPADMHSMAKYAALLFPVLMAVHFSACQQARETKPFDPHAQPLKTVYKNDGYAVQRHWVTLPGADASDSLSVFIHIPVVAARREPRPVLPIPAWREKHYRDMAPKVGAGIANSAALGVFEQAADPQPAGKKFPLLIFGPGLGWLPTDYYNILLPLVRSGVIVATVAARPISKTVYYPGGGAATVPKPEAQYVKLAGYLSAAANELLSRSATPGHPLYGMIDTGRVAAGGHSVSGASALLAAANNPRIKAVVNLDGDVNDDIVPVQPLQPILYITTQPPSQDEADIGAWASDRSEKRRDGYFTHNAAKARASYRMKVPGMYHSDFQDVATLKDSMEERYVKNRFGSIAPAYAHSLTGHSLWLFMETAFTPGKKWDDFKRENPEIFVEIRGGGD